MKKIFCAILLVCLIAGTSHALEKRIIRLGLLSKLNSTEEQFTETWKKTFAPKNQLLDIVVKFYDTLTTMQMALNAREIHEMVLPDFTARYLMTQSKEYTSILVLQSRGTGLAFGFREDNRELRDKFSMAVKTLRDNLKLAALEGMYTTGDYDPVPVSFMHFDDAETVRVAVTGDMPPIDYVRADGTPAGFNTAVLAEIGSLLGMNIELVEIDSGARTAALASGRADVVFWYEVDLSSEIQPDVPDGVILSEPYYTWNRFIHLRKAEKKAAEPEKWDIKRSIIDMLFGR